MWSVRNSWYGLLFLAVFARADGGPVKPDVEVCLNPGGDASAVLRAESLRVEPCFDYLVDALGCQHHTRTAISRGGAPPNP